MMQLKRCLVALVAISSVNGASAVINVIGGGEDDGDGGRILNEWLVWVPAGTYTDKWGNKIVMTDTEIGYLDHDEDDDITTRTVISQNKAPKKNKFWRNVWIAGAVGAGAVGFHRYLYPNGKVDTTVKNIDKVVYPVLGKVGNKVGEGFNYLGGKWNHHVAKPLSDKIEWSWSNNETLKKTLQHTNTGLKHVGNVWNQGVQSVKPHVQTVSEQLKQWKEDARDPTRKWVETQAGHGLNLLRRIPALKNLGVKPQAPPAVPVVGDVPSVGAAGVEMPSVVTGTPVPTAMPVPVAEAVAPVAPVAQVVA